jgi:hypothetical protein
MSYDKKRFILSTCGLYYKNSLTIVSDDRQ